MLALFLTMALALADPTEQPPDTDPEIASLQAENELLRVAIGHFQTEVAERKATEESLRTALFEKDQAIEALHDALEAKDRVITLKDSELAHNHEYINYLEGRVAKKGIKPWQTAAIMVGTGTLLGYIGHDALSEVGGN